jgi:hypothetical protein
VEEEILETCRIAIAVREAPLLRCARTVSELDLMKPLELLF